MAASAGAGPGNTFALKVFQKAIKYTKGLGSSLELPSKIGQFRQYAAYFQLEKR